MIGKIRSCPCRLLEARHFSGGNRPKRKMHSFIFALFASIVVVHVSAQYRPYYDDNLYPHPSYPLSDGRSPNVAYDHRLFFSYLTSTTTTTTTTTTTCTVLTALACVGRRRRSFLQNDDDPIEPSAVNKSVTEHWKESAIKIQLVSYDFYILTEWRSHRSRK